MTKVFVVILNWNGWEDTIACLQSVTKCRTENIKLEIVVVDNASTNDSVRRIEALKLKNLKIVVNSENLGFSGGNNVGIKYALKHSPDYVCLLNNDTVVDKNLFEDLLDAFGSHPNAGIISPKIYFAKGFEFHTKRYKKDEMGRVIWYAGGVVDWANVYGSNKSVDEVDNGQLRSDYQTDFATGACMMISSKVLQEVGVLDEKYYLYLEDTDLSLRSKLAGYEVWFAAKPYLWHKVSRSSGIGSNLNEYFITRNRLMFGMRYASLRTKFALARESIRMYFNGRPWQKIGVKDYYLGKLGKGSWGNKKYEQTKK